MHEMSVSRRYAEALIEITDDSEAILADLKGFDGLLDANDGELRNALCTPIFSGDERTNILTALLPKLGLNPLTGNFLQVLNAKGRLTIFSDITRAYSQLADERAGRVTVRVTTAKKMTKTIESDVSKALSKSTGKQVVLQADVDPELIGGMVVRVDGKVYDSSIKTRLQTVKRTLLAAQTPASAK